MFEGKEGLGNLEYKVLCSSYYFRVGKNCSHNIYCPLSFCTQPVLDVEKKVPRSQV